MKPPRSILLAATIWATTAAPAAAGPVATRPAPTTAPAAIDVERALKDLESGDWLLQAEAMELLARWRVQGAAARLRAVTADGDRRPWVRGRALVTLAKLLGERAAPDALAAAGSKLPELRAAAMEALGLLRLGRNEAAIRKALGDADAAVGGQAVVALARLRGQAAWDAVSSRLADRDAVLVRHATRALRYVATDEARGAAVRQIEHTDAGVRAEAADTIAAAGIRAGVSPLLAHMAGDESPAVRRACEKALASLPKSAVAGPLVQALRAEQGELYAAALKILAIAPTEAVARELASIFARPGDRYAAAAPAALGVLARMQPNRHKEIFVRYLDHADASARAAAAVGVGRCKAADHYALLRPRLVDANELVRAAAYAALEPVKAAPPGGALAYLSSALRHDSAAVRGQAVAMLGKRITPAEAPRGLAMLRGDLSGDDDDLRKAIAGALGAAGGAKLAPRIAAAQGYLCAWRVVGPFPMDRGGKYRYPPEWEIDFRRTYETVVHDRQATARVTSATCGGERKSSLLLRAASTKSVFRATIAMHLLKLPAEADLKLKCSVGLTGRPRTDDGARFELRLAGRKLLERKLTKAGGWQDVEADLSAHAGQTIAVEWVFDALEQTRDEELAVGEPRVVAGDKTRIDVLELQPPHPARVSFGDKQLPPVGWKRYDTISANGLIDLAPIYAERPDGMAYAVADFESPAGRAVKMTVFANRDFAGLLNGEKLGDGKTVWDYWDRGQLRVLDATVRKGRNRLFLRMRAGAKGFAFLVRLHDADGRAVAGLTGVTP